MLFYSQHKWNCLDARFLLTFFPAFGDCWNKLLFVVVTLKYYRCLFALQHLIGGIKLQRCWNCNAEVTDDSKFCPTCGKSFATPPTDHPSPQPSSYAQFPPPYNANQQPALFTMDMAKKINTTFVISICTLALIVALWMIILIWYASRDQLHNKPLFQLFIDRLIEQVMLCQKAI